MPITRTFTCLAVTASILGASLAEAEESAADATMETMTVTARKQEENIQDVPIAMSVYDEVMIQDRMMESLYDARKYTPGLDIISYGASMRAAPSMRGLYSDYATKASTVGLFVDGVPVIDGNGFDETLLNIERIEVLKGPQGTLYGKNTEVGAVNIISKKPGNAFEARASLELGEDNKRYLTALASGPVVKDRFYVGVSAKHYEKDGFVENTFLNKTEDDREHNYGKLNLRWTPTEKLEASFMASFIKYDDGGQSGGLVGQPDREVRSDLDTYNQSETFLSSLDISYTFNDRLSLDSITAYRNFHKDLGNDWDYSESQSYKFHAFNDSKFRNLSEELRLNYESDKVKSITGIFLDFGNDDEGFLSEFSAGSSAKSTETDVDSQAIFSHLTYMVNNKFSLVGGLRYDRENKDYEETNQSLNYDEDEITPKLGLVYNVHENMMTYVTVAKGYRSGGFNTFGDEDTKTYGMETLYSYEMGIKGTSLNGRLNYDAAIYYMDINDMQVDVYIDPSRMIKDNAAEATSKGFETSIDYRLVGGLSLFAGFAYNDISFDDYFDGKTNYSGNRTTYSPEYNFNVGAMYRSASGLYASADLSGYGKSYLDVKNEYKRDPYEIFNVKAGYEAKHYDLYLYARNLFDAEYDLEGMYDGFYAVYSPPREIGVALTYRF